MVFFGVVAGGSDCWEKEDLEYYLGLGTYLDWNSEGRVFLRCRQMKASLGFDCMLCMI